MQNSKQYRITYTNAEENVILGMTISLIFRPGVTLLCTRTLVVKYTRYS